MREIILDERAWAEDALSRLELGPKPMATIGRIARYYYAEGYTKKEIPKLLMDFLIKCDPDIQKTMWEDLTELAAKHADKYPLIDISGVTVYKEELDTIAGLQSRVLRKLMFTLLCLAKYSNAINPKNNNWVNFAAKDIFSIANIKTTTTRQSLLINDLWRSEMVGYSSAINNVNMYVKILKTEGEEILTITDFRSLGNQYLQYTEGGFIQCECCGEMIRLLSNRQRYCANCAVEAHRKRMLENYYTKVS